MKVEPDPIDAGLGASQRVVDARQAADLHTDDGVRHATRSSRRTARRRRLRTPAAIGRCAGEPTGSGHSELVERCLELVLGVDSDQPVDFLAVFEDQHGRNGRDAQAARRVLVFVGVHLADLDLAFVLARQLFDGRAQASGKGRTTEPRNRPRLGSGNPGPPTSSFRR